MRDNRASILGFCEFLSLRSDAVDADALVALCID